MKFPKFDDYVCPGDSVSFEYNGVTYTTRIVFDEDYHIDDDDCHNTDQSVTGCSDEHFKHLLKARNAWFNDEWFYGGVVISAELGGWSSDYLASLWGIEVNYPRSDGETDNSYLSEVADELLEEAITQAEKELRELKEMICV